MNDKFNIIMDETEGSTLCVQVEKVISAEGYAENFLPRINEIVQKHGELNILIYYKSYKGWEEDAAKQDMVTSALFSKNLKKLALVNPPEKEVFQRTLKNALSKTELKLFNEEDLQKALEWVKA